MKFSLWILLTAVSTAQASFWDIVPLVAQVKSAIQAIAGDQDGAIQTQENFSRRTPFLPIPFIRAAVEASMGNSEAAKETMKSFLNTQLEIYDSIPIVGHVKGGIHYATGDRDSGDRSMKSASRSVGVVAGGFAGMAVLGPAGAAAGAITGGTAMDGIITGIDSAIHEEFRPHGHILSVTRLVNKESDVGEVVDFGLNVVGEGLAAFVFGKYGNTKGSGVTKGGFYKGSKTSSTNALVSI